MGIWQFKPQIGKTINIGYGVTQPRDRNLPENHNGNCILSNGFGGDLYLWVEEVIADFEMGGTTSQSRRRKQFFPHNFQMVNFIVRGRHGSIFQANRLAEFIRQTHTRSLGTNTQTVTMTLFGQTGDFGKGTNRHSKGNVRSFTFRGHIEKANFGAERHIYAPTFEFPFSVQYSSDPLFRSDRATPSTQITQADILAAKLAAGDLERDPDFDRTVNTGTAVAGALNKIISDLGLGQGHDRQDTILEKIIKDTKPK